MDALIGNPAAESQYLAGEREAELTEIRREFSREELVRDAAQLEADEAIRSGNFAVLEPTAVEFE